MTIKQPAPDVQAQWPRCAKCEHDAHPLDCAERGCLCPHGTDVQAQSMGHNAEVFRRGWMAGQADALKQIDAARAEERKALLRLIDESEGDIDFLKFKIRARSGARGV